MTVDSLRTERTSATIYQFPVGGRRGLETKQTSAADLSPRMTSGAFDSWYHEAAIQEAKRPQ